MTESDLGAILPKIFITIHVLFLKQHGIFLHGHSRIYPPRLVVVSGCARRHQAAEARWMISIVVNVGLALLNRHRRRTNQDGELTRSSPYLNHDM
jgi:hypothetical protein